MAGKEEVIEVCPSRMKENDFMWNVKSDGYKAHCMYCGERLVLCSECPKYNNGCDYSTKTDSCSKVTEHGRK